MGEFQKNGNAFVGAHAGLALKIDVTFEVCPFEAFTKLPIQSHGVVC